MAKGDTRMNIRTLMIYKAIFLWERRGYIWTGGRWVKHDGSR